MRWCIAAACLLCDAPSTETLMPRTRNATCMLTMAAFFLCGPAPAAEQDLSVNARLLIAARDGDAPALERALKAGAAINSRNRLGETVLLIALKKNELAMATTMLDLGADVN